MTTTTTNGTSERLQELIDGIAGGLDRLVALLVDLDERTRAQAIGRPERAQALVEAAAFAAEARVAR